MKRAWRGLLAVSALGLPVGLSCLQALGDPYTLGAGAGSTGGGTSTTASVGSASAGGSGGGVMASVSVGSTSTSSAASSGSMGCLPGYDVCGGECTDTKVDPDNCGGCKKLCSNTQVCAAGACVCRPGFTGCPSGDPTLCVDLSHDPGHCGTCTNACGNTLCLPPNGSTMQATCAVGMAPCPANTTVCDDGCYENFEDSQLDCGACGVACSNAQVCVAGECAPANVVTDCDACAPGAQKCCMYGAVTICVAGSACPDT
jgi:hypothetical protein